MGKFVSVTDPASPGAVLLRAATTSAGKVFISENGGTRLIELDLTNLTYTFRTEAGGNLVSSSTADGSKVVFAERGGSGGGVFLWNAASDSFTSQGVQDSLGDVAVSGDGNLIVVSSGDQIDANNNSYVLDSQLHFVAFPTYPDLAPPVGRWVPGIKLHPSGSLYYLPRQQGIDIIDVMQASLRLQVVTPEPLLTPQNVGYIIDGMVLDATGQTLFAISSSGLTVIQLFQVPLGIGSVTPGQGPSGGGTTVTIRGSGFEAGATVTWGNEAINATVVDANTISVTTPPGSAGATRLTITNADGRQYTLDAAFLYQ